MRLRECAAKASSIIGCVLCAVFLFGYQARAAAHKLFGNLTYLTGSPDIAEKVTLINSNGVVWNERLHVSLYYEGHYVYGDFNQDGLKDAAVVIGESQGGSDNELSLAFLIHDGTRLVHRQSAYLGDSAVMNSLKVDGDNIIVDMFIHQKGDCQAGPTKRVKRVYEYDGSHMG